MTNELSLVIHLFFPSQHVIRPHFKVLMLPNYSNFHVFLPLPLPHRMKITFEGFHQILNDINNTFICQHSKQITYEIHYIYMLYYLHIMDSLELISILFLINL